MKKLLPIIALTTLSACSTITSGTTQPFKVLTPGAEGAKCELVDSKEGRWIISSTPETREITKGDGPLTVTCSKSGFKTASVDVAEGFAGATLGNVILGGGIGLVVDAASGAAQEYPDEVTVWLEPNSFKSSAAKEAWFAEKAAFEAEQEAEKVEQQRELNSENSYN